MSTPNAQRLLRIVNAANAEASEIRYEAEEAARALAQQAEADARRHVETERRRAEEIVLTGSRRLATLSEEIQEQYRGIVERLDAVRGVGTEIEVLVATLTGATEQLSWQAGEVRLAADAPIDRVE
jgi:vacuolar-type H+-ATPase subunit E/Vma4